MPTEFRTCPSCGDERRFEAPPCPDGHGGSCPELACVDCGTAVLVGPPILARWSRQPSPARPSPVRMSDAA
jgi:hypothetical protein